MNGIRLLGIVGMVGAAVLPVTACGGDGGGGGDGDVAGAAGAAGEPGDSGDSGGSAGSAGDQGALGGRSGTSGAAGDTGDSGGRGGTGGSTGTAGEAGATGVTGGSTGTAGEAGATGVTGGSTGNSGAAGSAGIPGSAGSAGSAAGSAGTPGSAGAAGAAGSPGSAGSTAGSAGDGSGTAGGSGEAGSAGAVSGGGSSGATGSAGAAGSPSQACTPTQAATCDAHADCTLELGAPVCTCTEGWTGPGDICIDVNECTGGTHNCDANATCTNTQGSFTCACNEYYGGNGTFCYLADPEVYVADISDRPIVIQISGVGTYDIHAMGRLAAEFSYVSTTGTPPRIMNRTPTGWQVHDLVIQNISAQAGSSIQDLVTWAGTTTSQIATITLDGLGAELLALTLLDVVSVSADTTVANGQMAELVLAIGNTEWETSTYTPPFEVGAGAPNTTTMEINGVAVLSFMPENLTEALPDTADPIEMRKIGTSEYSNAGDLFHWFDNNIEVFDALGYVERRALSEVHMGAAGTEVDRYNCYETFPYLIYFFNPTKTYGSSYLLDVSLATELCELG